MIWFMLGESQKENLERSHKNKYRAKPYKRMTSLSTQNLKALDLWIFFLSYMLLKFLIPT